MKLAAALLLFAFLALTITIIIGLAMMSPDFTSQLDLSDAIAATIIAVLSLTLFCRRLA